MRGWLLAAALAGTSLGWAQEVPETPKLSGSGTVLFSTEKGPPQPGAARPAGAVVPEVTAAEREALTFTRYDLDVHLAPARAGIAVRAALTVRNDGAAPLSRVAMQVSSSLRWESVTVAGAPAALAQPFAQQDIDTDADHTGKASEVVVTLASPLAVGASLELTAFYGGTIAASAERLERIGAPVSEAAGADWDTIAPGLTALRGYGNVLWYPVAGEPVFLGDGAKLFQAVGRSRLRQAEASARLRLSVEYVGDAPDAAFFCGRRQLFAAVSENQDVPVAESPGVATADFGTEALGFRPLSLFVTDRAPTVTADGSIAAVTDHNDAVPAYAAAEALVKPLLVQWLGAAPLEQLALIDHRGQPFADRAFAVLPLRAAPAGTLAPSLLHLLVPAWFMSPQPWLQEGVPEFLSLLWMEESKGREAAVATLEDGARTLSLAEPDLSQGKAAGQALAPLTAGEVGASDPVYLRTKAAAVLWMLRGIAGDEALKQALGSVRKGGVSDPRAFEGALERASGKDLRWFFNDWVYRDRGLPDLSIVSVTPRQLPAQGGKDAGWLVAVEVRNDGDAVAEVPVTVRSGSLTATTVVRVAGRATASTRVLFQAVPEEVLVNDGTVPEARTSLHTMAVQARSGD